ncbi:Ig-like domain-containing protein, partial [Aeromonas sobria]|nr:Ig-like domain-containing protein [Aeromonas sobria]
ANVGNAPISGTSDVGSNRTVTLVITDASGKSVTVTAVTDANGDYNTTADLSGLADGNLEVVASVTDAAGNPASATDDTTLLDTSASATITVDSITADDILNAQEAAGNVTVTGRVGGDAAIGDTVTMEINGTLYTTRVIALVGGGLGFSLPVAGRDLALDTTFTATVTGSDDAGNPFTASTTS